MREIVVDQNVLALRVGQHVDNLLVLHQRAQHTDRIRPQHLRVGTLVNRAVEHVLRVVVVAAVVLVIQIAPPQHNTAAQIRNAQKSVIQC